MQRYTFMLCKKWQLAVFLCLLAYLPAATAQKVENVRTFFDQSKQLMFISYDLKGMNYAGLNWKKEIQIIPYIESGDTLKILENLEGDWGWVTRGGKKKVIWNPFKDGMNSLDGVLINFRLQVRNAPIPRYWGIEAQGSNSAPFGIKGMRLSDFGFFAGFRVGKLPPSYRYTVTNAGEMNYLESGVYEIGTEKRLASYAITAGPIFQIARNIYVYAGAGYGIEQIYWKYQAYNLNKDPIGSFWALNEGVNSKGPAIDIGVILRLLGPVFIDLGLSNINFQSKQITFGLGYLLTKKWNQ